MNTANVVHYSLGKKKKKSLIKDHVLIGLVSYN